MNDTATRRLAAILAADVVGYSRLIEADEAATLAQLKALRRDVIDPEVAVHRGRVFKTMGDGFLAEFASVVDAVACAAAIQRANAQRMTAMSGEHRVGLRIGVNLGDVVADGGDLLGDGVNVAARLEGIADPGGLCISGAAHEHLKGKIELEFDDLGPQKMKNLQQPVRVFRARLDADAAPATRGPSKLGLAVAAVIAGLSMFGWVGWVFFAPEKTITPPSRQAAARATATTDDQRPALIVLPFANLSNDPEQEYFSDGFTEDLTTALSRIPGFLVMARNTAFTFKGKSVNAQQVGRDLGVRYVLEGSVRKQGDRLRLNAQLIDTLTGAHVWAEKYDRPMAEIFIAQDEIADKIVGLVASNIRRREGEKALAAPPEKLEAYELTMRGRLLWYQGGKEPVLEAQRLLTSATLRDPQFVPGYIWLSRTGNSVFSNRYDDNYASLDYARRMAALAERALAMAPESPMARATLALWLSNQGLHDEALVEANRALALAPNDPEILGSTPGTFYRSGQYARALEVIRKLMTVDPFANPATVGNSSAQSLFGLGRYDDAVDAARTCVRLAPSNTNCRYNLITALAHSGRIDEARTQVAELLRVSPGSTVAEDRRRRLINYKDSEFIERFAEGLRKAGLPE